MNKVEKIIITLAIASAGGFTGYKLGLPAGTFMGAMAAGALYNIFTGNASIPPQMKVFAQILLGGIIGTGLSMPVLKGFRELIIPVAIFVALLFLFSIVSALIIAKVTGMDLVTALFSCSPGGLSEMTIVADFYKGHMPTVAIIHLSRILSVVVFYPVIAKIFIK